MWTSPEVSRNSWAVTKCLTEHGNGNTRWTPAHVVAVAMWYGGVKAGLQAAKAIRIFGIWSHDEHDGLPSVNDRSSREDLLHKLWPSTPAQQTMLHRWAQRSHPEIPLPDFEAAHRHLLRECIGPDLTKFPTVVRPKLDLGQRASRRWASLITQEQWRETLAPVLCKYFDPRVDLESLSKEIVAGSFNGGRINSYAGNAYAKNNQRAKTGGSCAPSRAINKEINLPQTDDQDDDEEPSYPKLTAPAAVKKEPGLWNRSSSFDSSRTQPCALPPKLPDQKNSYISGSSETPDNNAAQDVGSWSTANSHATCEAGPHERQQSTTVYINETRSDAQPPMSATTVHAGEMAEGPSDPTYVVPLELNKQILNKLYLETCNFPLHVIAKFPETGQPALRREWEEICSYRAWCQAWSLELSKHPPCPEVTAKSIHPRSRLGGIQAYLSKSGDELAEDDLSKFKKFYRAEMAITSTSYEKSDSCPSRSFRPCFSDIHSPGAGSLPLTCS